VQIALAVAVALGTSTVAATTATGCGGTVDPAPEPEPEASEQAFCAKQCEVPADCCPDDAPEGAPECPGAYPRNWGCEEGLCVTPRCETDADCTEGACRATDGVSSCVRTCSADADCEPEPDPEHDDGISGGLGSIAATCSATSDDGTRICAGEIPPCESDDDCLAPGSHCLGDGRCGCRADDDCAGASYQSCRGGQCSCGSDADCGPSLDVCTTDVAYRYPSSAGAVGKPAGTTTSGSTSSGR
jgi:hypothetical protein